MPQVTVERIWANFGIQFGDWQREVNADVHRNGRQATTTRTVIVRDANACGGDLGPEDERCQ